MTMPMATTGRRRQPGRSWEIAARSYTHGPAAPATTRWHHRIGWSFLAGRLQRSLDTGRRETAPELPNCRLPGVPAVPLLMRVGAAGFCDHSRQAAMKEFTARSGASAYGDGSLSHMSQPCMCGAEG